MPNMHLFPLAGENGLPSAVDDMDLPSMITRVLGKACTQLLVSPGRPDEEGISLYINLLDRTLAHEAFNNTQVGGAHIG